MASALGNLTLEVENKIYQQIIFLYDKCSIISKLNGGRKKSADLRKSCTKEKTMDLSFEDG